MKDSKKSDFHYEIEEYLSVLSTNDKGWTKEINLISWNDRPAKFDIRDWSADKSKMSKGITLTEEEAKNLCKVLYLYFKQHG